LAFLPGMNIAPEFEPHSFAPFLSLAAGAELVVLLLVVAVFAAALLESTLVFFHLPRVASAIFLMMVVVQVVAVAQHVEKKSDCMAFVAVALRVDLSVGRHW